jgi:hypothetical protein
VGSIPPPFFPSLTHSCCFLARRQDCSSALTPGDYFETLRQATKIGQGYAFLSPSLPILLREIEHPNLEFVFGSDHDFTISIFLQQLLGVHVYTHVVCWVRPCSYWIRP